MKHTFVFLLMYGLLALADTLAQSVDELEKRNGFKDIKLMSEVGGYEGLEYKKETDHELYKTIGVYKAKKGHYQSIGTLKIVDLEVLTYKGGVFEIKVLAEKDPKLYRGLKKSFGEPKFSLRGNTYYWTAPSLSLSYRSHDKNKLELIYKSSLMKDRLKDDKQQEIEDISSDF